MGYVLGKRSNDNLIGVHPDLEAVVRRAIQLTKQDFLVLEGVRTQRRQYELFAKGRSVAQLRAAGVPSSVLARPGERKVTWTLNSRHKPGADGFGRAVDLVPWPIDWNDLRKFDKVVDAMEQAAKELSIKIRCGCDWDGDGNRRERGETDSPHFEMG